MFRRASYAIKNKVTNINYEIIASEMLFAIRHNHLGTVQKLIQKHYYDAKFFRTVYEKGDPVVAAVEAGHYDIARCFLNHPRVDAGSLRYVGSEKVSLQAFTALLDDKGKVKLTADGAGALLLGASMRGALEKVKLLFAHTAATTNFIKTFFDVTDESNHNGEPERTPLRAALFSSAVFEELLAHTPADSYEISQVMCDAIRNNLKKAIILLVKKNPELLTILDRRGAINIKNTLGLEALNAVINLPSTQFYVYVDRPVTRIRGMKWVEDIPVDISRDIIGNFRDYYAMNVNDADVLAALAPFRDKLSEDSERKSVCRP